MDDLQAIDLVEAWRRTLLDDITTGAHRFGGKQSVRETADALETLLRKAKSVENLRAALVEKGNSLIQDALSL